jgi:hypothetical protein
MIARYCRRRKMSNAFGSREGPPLAALRLDLVLLALFCVLALGGTAVALIHEERQALDDPVQQGERGEVAGADGLSLLAPANLTHALATARAKLAPDDQVTNLRLTPTRMDVLVRNTVGAQRQIRVGLDYDAVTVSVGTSSSSGPRGLTGIDVNAPARALAAILARERWSPRTLDYAVYQAPHDSTPARWDLFFKNVPIERNHVAADGAGRLSPT